jgi:hypothetical protein
MAAKPTTEPAAAPTLAERASDPSRAETPPEAPRTRSPLDRLRSWLRGDRYMVDAYRVDPPGDGPAGQREQ